MDVNDGIWAYEPAICRSLGAHYIGKSKYKGERILLISLKTLINFEFLLHT